MKTIKAIILCALLSLTSSAFAENEFSMSFSDVKIEAGSTADLKVTFESSVTIAGWQMFLYLPKGIEIAYDEEEEEYSIALSDLHAKKHACEVTKAKDGSMMLVMTGGTKTYEMSGNSGDLCTITLKASADFSGSSDVAVNKIRISDKSGKAYAMADTSFKLEGGSTGIKDVNADGAVNGTYKYVGKDGNLVIKTAAGQEFNAVGGRTK
jgi:hypothetical protein